MQRNIARVLLCLGVALMAGSALAQQATVASVAPTALGDARWEDSIRAFEAQDREHQPTTGGVLFVGSSSIRLWSDLEQQFNTVPGVIKRGFGGSTLSACSHYVQRLVLPYKPHLVLVYAGDNDLAEGRTPEEVAYSFTRFVNGVRAELPDTRIAYISIKPSPSRIGLAEQIRQTNTLIRQYIAKGENLDYVDIYTPMLQADGAPRIDLFRADMLHLNDTGYALWKQVITAHLK
jgi:lysophospholipase L1-like esterase